MAPLGRGITGFVPCEQTLHHPWGTPERPAAPAPQRPAAPAPPARTPTRAQTEGTTVSDSTAPDSPGSDNTGVGVPAGVFARGTGHEQVVFCHDEPTGLRAI